jgi:hypothetical protein
LKRCQSAIAEPSISKSNQAVTGREKRWFLPLLQTLFSGDQLAREHQYDGAKDEQRSDQGERITEPRVSM